MRAGMSESGIPATVCHTHTEIFMQVRGLEKGNTGGYFVKYYPSALPWSQVMVTELFGRSGNHRWMIFEWMATFDEVGWVPG